MALPPAPKVEDLSFQSRWASIAIRSSLADIQRGIPSLPNEVDRNQLAAVKESLWEGNDDGKQLKVGIIGAGVAGLFTALIFDHLKQEFGLDVQYEIIEANKEERVGGRLFSYYFKDVENPGPHDYYDVGAMRFPEIDIMKRTFDLFTKVCKMSKHEGPEPPKAGDLIPYYLDGPNNPMLYNDIQVVQKKDEVSGEKDVISGKTFDIGIQEKYLDKAPGKLVDGKIKPFIDRFHKDPAQGWKDLIEFGDKYSVRQYFRNEFDYNTIEWLETYNFGNRWYDQALSEMILEDLDFNHTAPWWCVEGGSQQAAYRMREAIAKDPKRETIQFGKTVSKIGWAEANESIDVTIKGESSSRRYDAVFNSAPLGSMQRMDLVGLNLHYRVKQAIRSLGYGASCKVGIRFKNLWWIEKLNIDKGGVAKTDLPLRVCVYPSYNLNDAAQPAKDGKPAREGKPGVLLCSYTWSQEAQRIASLIKNDSPEGEDELRALLIDNLARLHSKTRDSADYKRLHTIISDAYETHYAYDWYADPCTTGAFAYFGPSQFREMYPWITRSDGKHVIIGEAASAHHAWVVGALESAVRGVYQFLYRHSRANWAAHSALLKYHRGEIASPYGPLPLEYDRTEDIKYIVPEKVEGDGVAHVGFGEWAREQVLFEKIRLEQGGDQLVPEKVTEEQTSPFGVLASA